MVIATRALALTVALCSSIAGATPDPRDVATAVATEQLKAGPIAGMSIAIVQDGKTLFAGGFGKAELDNDVAATEQTVYRINSITKAFTATLILQLAEAGKLRLEDHVSKYFPEYTHDHDPTLVQLLTHTSGMASYQGPLFHKSIKLDLTAKQWVDALAADKLFLAAPDTAWSYSNAAYDLLGMIATKLTGEDLAHLFATRIAAPAGLTQTALCDTRAVVPHRARSYVWVKDHFEHAESWGTYGEASGGLCSSVLDLVKFVQALDAGKLVSARSLARMRAPRVLPGGQSFDYGLGTRRGHVGKTRVIAYTGSGEEWSSAAVEVADRKLLVVVLANTAPGGEGSSPALAMDIVRRLLGITDHLADLAVPAALGAKLAGKWQSPDGSVHELAIDNHHLVAKDSGHELRFYYQGRGSFRTGDDTPLRGLEIVFDLAHKQPALSVYRSGVFSEGDLPRRIGD
ncbi:MAG: serine hydrolase domain-containing protein [Acidobacteriota bacterium]